jgi:hypothetical protein
MSARTRLWRTPKNHKNTYALHRLNLAVVQHPAEHISRQCQLVVVHFHLSRIDRHAVLMVDNRFQRPLVELVSLIIDTGPV